MLVLTRKLNEKLVIGNDIVVSIVKIEGNKVRLSIEAPGDVRILRGELVTWIDEPASSNAEPALAAHG